MTAFFDDLSTAALARVIDDNLIEKSLSFPRFFGGEIHGPDPLWFITGPAMPGNNGIAQANLAKETVAEEVAAALEPFQARKLAMTWWVGPNSAPSNLGETLQRQGLTHNRDMIGMAAPLSVLDSQPLPELPLQFERVADKAMLTRWYEIILQCFPGSYSQSYLDGLAAISLQPEAEWVHYVALHKGEVIGASSLFLGAGVAGLYNLGTTPAWRKQGIGAWMTIKTYRDSQAMGYQVGTLQTTYPNALRLYHRLGFEVYCKIGIYRLG